jgi:hypothetical protein
VTGRTAVVSSAGSAGDISAETRLIATRVRERAAHAPQASEIAAMALTPGADMTPDEIRQLATDAIAQAARVAYLLGNLAALMDSDDRAGSAGA